MHPAYLVVIFCVLFALVLLAATAATRFLESDRQKKVRDMLRTAGGAPDLPESTILLGWGRGPSQGLSHWLSQLPLLRRVQVTIYQAGLTWPVTTLLLYMGLAAIAGMLLSILLRTPFFRELWTLALGVLFGAAPYIYVRRKRAQRLRAFEEQFPEALDFLARSLRAGHAFSVSLEMMADESPDPIGIEFRQLFNEQNLGSPIDVAMRNMASRVPLLDVRFFVSAVLLQRETGGNLAEILTKLGYVIRERFRLKGQVRAASAHGRLTAGVLTVMPAVTALGLMAVWPGYLAFMAGDKHGRFIILGAIILQTTGYFVMKRIVNIKV